MAAQKKMNLTKKNIIHLGTKMFLEKGYTDTTTRQLCDALGISPGNLTFHFKTKEHLLAVLTKMLCDHQWLVMERSVDEGKTSLMAQCLELTAMAAICEENEKAKDLYLSMYTHPMTLDIIRRNDAEKARQVFGSYCPDWTDINYCEAETIVSGIEFSTLLTTENSAPLHVRIAGALGAMMMIYNVPADVRRMKMDKVLAMDYRAIGRQILNEFIEYIENANEASYSL